jgi:hypothetical protein
MWWLACLSSRLFLVVHHRSAQYVEKRLIVFQRADQRPLGAIIKVNAHCLTTDNINSIGAYLAVIQAKEQN